jgi:hypothetical protein
VRPRLQSTRLWHAVQHQVVQFKDVETNKFVAVAVDGEVKEYGLAG